MLDQSLWAYVLTANPIVQIVIAILLLASIWSWTIVFQQGFSLLRARAAVKRFEKKFATEQDISKLFAQYEKKGDRNKGLAFIFYSGIKEYMRLLPGINAWSERVSASVQRAMRVAAITEEESLESNISVLATIGSTSPYIGLFGTVWGIMMAFHALGGASQVTIAMVAPGISEALIATAVGLFAAIPAVIFYNCYVNQTDKLLMRYDAFQEELINRLQFQAMQQVKQFQDEEEVVHA